MVERVDYSSEEEYQTAKEMDAFAEQQCAEYEAKMLAQQKADMEAEAEYDSLQNRETPHEEK
jgi:hypothetical protein